MTLDPAVEALRAAVDREAARAAAYDVARVAVDDAVAVTPGAHRVVATVRRLIEDGTPWRADALAALIYVLDHAHVYRDLRADTRTYRGQWDWGVAEEEAVERALDGLDVTVRDLLDDKDPETRSLASLTLARISSDPPADRELLRLLAASEPDGRARASLAEAMLRLGEPGAADSPETQDRVAWYLAATGRETDHAVRDEPSWRWPAEEM